MQFSNYLFCNFISLSSPNCFHLLWKCLQAYFAALKGRTAWIIFKSSAGKGEHGGGPGPAWLRLTTPSESSIFSSDGASLCASPPAPPLLPHQCCGRVTKVMLEVTRLKGRMVLMNKYTFGKSPHQHVFITKNSHSIPHGCCESRQAFCISMGVISLRSPANRHYTRSRK